MLFRSLNVLKQAAEKRKTAAKEASLEQSTDVSGNESVKDPYLSKRKGLFEKAWDFIAGNDEEDGGDDGGPNIDIDFQDGLERKPRRPGVRRRLARRKFNSGKRKIGEGLRKAGEFASEKGGRVGKFLQRKGGDALNFGKKIGGKALEAGKSGIARAGKFIMENPKIAKLEIGRAHV